MWSRVCASVQRLLLAASARGRGPGAGVRRRRRFRAVRKRPRCSLQNTEEQEAGQWKRFKMGDLVDTVKNTAEGVKQTTSTVLNWVRSQSPSCGPPALSPAPGLPRVPISQWRLAPRPPASVHSQVPRNSLEDPCSCLPVEPAWSPLPRPARTQLPMAESFLASGDQCPAAKRPLNSPRGLGRANGHARISSTPRSRTGGSVQFPRLENAQVRVPSPSPPKQGQHQFVPMYSKTFEVGRARIPDTPHCSSTASDPSVPTRPRPTRRNLSTVEETILKEEKEIYRQLLEVVTADYVNKSSLSRVFSPLSHREL
ncbi:uncharacterized protein [Heterodontus francisci]|uniref:uncharacterized protein n=1 Tax=Heterodontus francisci TaxID=7792 RepID=UPI00355BC188